MTGIQQVIAENSPPKWYISQCIHAIHSIYGNFPLTRLLKLWDDPIFKQFIS